MYDKVVKEIKKELYDSCYMMTWTRWNGPCEVLFYAHACELNSVWTSLVWESESETHSIHITAKHGTAQHSIAQRSATHSSLA